MTVRWYGAQNLISDAVNSDSQVFFSANEWVCCAVEVRSALFPPEKLAFK